MIVTNGRGRPKRWCMGLGLSLVLGFGVACAQDEGAANSPDLRDITIPTDFDFATSRALSLTMRAQLPNMGLRIHLDDGRVLYEGPVPTAPLELSVPTSEAEVVLQTYGAKISTQRISLAQQVQEVSL